jgi:hypothetical protein
MASLRSGTSTLAHSPASRFNIAGRFQRPSFRARRCQSDWRLAGRQQFQEGILQASQETRTTGESAFTSIWFFGRWRSSFLKARRARALSRCDQDATLQEF